MKKKMLIISASFLIAYFNNINNEFVNLISLLWLCTNFPQNVTSHFSTLFHFLAQCAISEIYCYRATDKGYQYHYSMSTNPK